jgi:hypothetical protein
VPRHRAPGPMRTWWMFTVLAAVLLSLLMAAGTLWPGRTSAGVPPVTTVSAE